MIAWAFWAFVLAATLFRVVYVENGVIDLAPDEAHYWEWSRNLDLSYYSKGPLVAYIVYLGTRFFGHTPLGVRIGAIVISVLTAWLLFVFVRELARDDGRTGLYAVVVLQAVPLFAAGSILMTIDAPFLLFWVLTMICLWRAIHSGASGYWLLAGAAMGLGLLAKYAMVF
ncbi:MAG TPA: glycosyltransferase family 39 protein, partial [Methylomirabilota bacterium]|nr:glycosyltransferase family 39 protein [Methylomirabilota bacterium]